jgi:hypothetical protein
MEPMPLRFGDLTAEAQAARLLHRRQHGVTTVSRLAAEAGLPVERAELLLCRGLATLLARGYPAEELCETYHITQEQLSQAANAPPFSSTFKPLTASR